jgi:CBS domain-containing protein
MIRATTVKEFMTKDVLTLHLDTPILRAVRMLRQANVTGAPVLDEHGRLVGILTEKDCMRVVLDSAYHGMPGGLVKDYMSSNPESVSPDETLIQLAQLFINGRFHRFPVVDNGRLIGIISRRDVMRAIAQHHPN